MVISPFIIIVNWNLKDDTLICIQSLLNAGADLVQIIVVDNGSTDGSVVHLRSIFGNKLQIIELNKNIGLAAGANYGFLAAIDRGAEWMFLINNDTWVAKDFFEKLSEAIKANPNISVFGPAIYYADKPNKIWFLGERNIFGALLTVHCYRGKQLPRRLPQTFSVDFLSGCAMLVRRKVFEHSGFLDEGFYMYAEEVDWCWRLRRSGHTLSAVPAAAMWHKVGTSSKNSSINTRYLQIRNQIWVYRRYGNFVQKNTLKVFTFLRVLWLSLRDFFAGRQELLRFSWQGWKDGWFRPLPAIKLPVQK